MTAWARYDRDPAGAEWRGTWIFVSGVPEQATRLTLALGDDALELEL